MKNFIVLLISATILGGCGPQSETIPDITTKPVVASVAQQTMGEGAISIYPFAYQKISAPGIYAVRANEQTGRHSYIEICSKDMEIAAISGMRKEQRTSNRTFSDILKGQSVSVATPFIAAKTRYTLHSVDGFKAESVRSGGSSDAAEWILENVGEKCRTTVLTRNDPYFVVTAVASSMSINVERGGGVEVTPFNIGIANVDIELSDQGSRVIQTERVFAISGKLYRNGKVTSHGAF